MDALTVLRRMLDALDEHGWGRRELINPTTGELCLIGASYVASGVGTPIRDSNGRWNLTFWFNDPAVIHPILRDLGPRHARNSACQALTDTLSATGADASLGAWNDGMGTAESARELIGLTITRLEQREGN